ncbi:MULTISPECIES: hypothetical protein [Modicisalibacter]|uniref:hypothetical protein n=1 Tax=Modicisalibacter TaxID=574347 RepID=UPI00100BFA9D|nr:MULTISPECIES: hypothetical protein [Halomonadaceae]MBZ9560300.1 hypothetical protein [Modicisalibacter sp. R2A 31.J]MBZ9576209.1 hypothetical protein [Modicisalibacter sp. MOD 31.J]
MFNRTRQVTCPHCQEANFWTGNPGLTDELYCRACEGFVTLYDDYIRNAIHAEAERVLAQFTEASTAADVAHLKQVLAEPEQRLSA